MMRLANNGIFTANSDVRHAKKLMPNYPRTPHNADGGVVQRYCNEAGARLHAFANKADLVVSAQSWSKVIRTGSEMACQVRAVVCEKWTA